MTPAEIFIKRLTSLKEGDRSCLRKHYGSPLDSTPTGFDLFTGIWWPLRKKSPAVPKRETSWLVTKLYGAFPVPHVSNAHGRVAPTLPHILGMSEPREENAGRRFRRRFDRLICSNLSGLEPHLRWALSVADNAVKGKKFSGLDWVGLLNNLSIWDSGEQHRNHQDIREIWVTSYLNAAYQSGRRDYSVD